MHFTNQSLNFFPSFLLEIKEDLKFHAFNIKLHEVYDSDFLIFEVSIEVFTADLHGNSSRIEKRRKLT